MKRLPLALFFSGYLLGGWVVIWLLVMVLGRGDVKFSKAVGFYYGIWIFYYLPIAVTGAMFLAKMSGPFWKRMIAAGLGLSAILVAMFFTFYLDAHWTILLAEYFGFGVSFWLLTKTAAKIEKADAGDGYSVDF